MISEWYVDPSTLPTPSTFFSEGLFAIALRVHAKLLSTVSPRCEYKVSNLTSRGRPRRRRGKGQANLLVISGYVFYSTHLSIGGGIRGLELQGA